jgi:hypothetical protein
MKSGFNVEHAYPKRKKFFREPILAAGKRKGFLFTSYLEGVVIERFKYGLEQFPIVV